MEEVAKHNKKGEVRILNGCVLNVSKFLNDDDNDEYDGDDFFQHHGSELAIWTFMSTL